MLSCKSREATRQPTYNVVVPKTTVNTVKLLVKYINYKSNRRRVYRRKKPLLINLNEKPFSFQVTS